MLPRASVLAAISLVLGCSSDAESSGSPLQADAALDAGATADGGPDGTADSGASGADAGPDASPDAAPPQCAVPDGGGDAGCYAITCGPGNPRSLQDNRDRLLADLATRKCTDRCTLWAALNEGERDVFLMDTAYLGAPASLIYPPGSANAETALDHAIALYSINGPDAGQGVLYNGMGGNDYNRIYLGFDALAACVMRDFSIANPTHVAGGNQWVKSDDLAGPHAPFTQRDMIAWFKATLDPQTQGPQFHFWHQDSDFTQSGLDQRLGVCGIADPTITELTIAFDTIHDSNPLGSYPADGTSKGGPATQIVDQFVGTGADWTYTPGTCSASAPVNTSTTGGGSFAGMGPSLVGSACAPAVSPDGGACP
jgi:hypothetical protein